MTNYAGPLYETNFVVTNEALSEFEPWLAETCEVARHHEGIEDIRILERATDNEGRTIQTCQFQAQDDHALDELLDGFFAEIDADAAGQFGDAVIVHSRTLRADHSHDLPPNESPVCLNCGTRLRGQYCGSCGQRSRNRLISIWQLLREAFGDLFELDSRLWRTLLPLLIRPGQLTRDYLEGRRARYMPPFRTYLVLSVIFFVVVFFNPKEDLKILFDPDPEPSAEEIAALEEEEKTVAAENKEQVDRAMQRLKEFDAEGKISEEIIAEIVDDDDENDITIAFDGDGNGFFDNCEEATISDEGDLPEWVKRRFTDERVQEICEKNKARGVDNFGDAIVDNVPVALIVLLPLMAMVLKVLYPLSRRYFVEHLLFFVHFHAFFFLILTLQFVFSRIVGLLGPEDGAIDSIGTLIQVIAAFYVPVYLYKAMRLVYGQGHLITIPKYILLTITYLAGATLTMFTVFLVAVLSV